MQPPARDVDHAELPDGRRAVARSHPGGQPRADPGGREVRLPHGLQALDLRDVVDPPGRHASARGPGQAHPPARARLRPGAPRDAHAPHARAEAEPRADYRRDRKGGGAAREARPRAARHRRGRGQPRDSHSRAGTASTAIWSRTRRPTRPTSSSRRASVPRSWTPRSAASSHGCASYSSAGSASPATTPRRSTRSAAASASRASACDSWRRGRCDELRATAPELAFYLET